MTPGPPSPPIRKVGHAHREEGVGEVAQLRLGQDAVVVHVEEVENLRTRGLLSFARITAGGEIFRCQKSHRGQDALEPTALHVSAQGAENRPKNLQHSGPRYMSSCTVREGSAQEGSGKSQRVAYRLVRCERHMRVLHRSSAAAQALRYGREADLGRRIRVLGGRLQKRHGWAEAGGGGVISKAISFRHSSRVCNLLRQDRPRRRRGGRPGQGLAEHGNGSLGGGLDRLD